MIALLINSQQIAELSIIKTARRCILKQHMETASISYDRRSCKYCMVLSISVSSLSGDSRLGWPRGHIVLLRLRGVSICSEESGASTGTPFCSVDSPPSFPTYNSVPNRPCSLDTSIWNGLSTQKGVTVLEH